MSEPHKRKAEDREQLDEVDSCEASGPPLSPSKRARTDDGELQTPLAAHAADAAPPVECEPGVTAPAVQPAGSTALVTKPAISEEEMYVWTTCACCLLPCPANWQTQNRLPAAAVFVIAVFASSTSVSKPALGRTGAMRTRFAKSYAAKASNCTTRPTSGRRKMGEKA